MSRGLKSYVIYLIIVAPFVIPVVLFIRQDVIRGAVIGVIVFGGLEARDRLQRRFWP